MAFYVGQKVACIALIKYPLNVQQLEVGRVYTIRKIFYGLGLDGPAVGLNLEEIVNDFHEKSGHEHGYDSRRFRPVVKTDISIFTAMLTPVETRTLTKEPA